MMRTEQTVPSSTSIDRQAFERIRAEYMEMPEMRLTPQQVQRLSGVDAAVCAAVLDDLVAAKFLRVGPDGAYLRLHGRRSPAMPRES